MFQTKLQDETPKRQLNETEITNLLGKDFKVTVINMLTDLQKSFEDLREDGSKEKHRKRATQTLRIK